MSLESGLEREVRDIIRKNRWLTLSTASPKGMPQSSVVVYASDGYTIYILTGKTTVKIRRLITIAPPAAITFMARAETREFDDSEATEFYEKKLNFKVPDNVGEEGMWIKLTPGKSATCLGVGVSLFELRDLEKSHKIIKLTNP